jgi:hypothetical protein
VSFRRWGENHVTASNSTRHRACGGNANAAVLFAGCHGTWNAVHCGSCHAPFVIATVPVVRPTANGVSEEATCPACEATNLVAVSGRVEETVLAATAGYRQPPRSTTSRTDGKCLNVADIPIAGNLATPPSSSAEKQSTLTESET